ncbi:MAG TPA: MogA/MoaB family molybdenum cofactor biosynthesis protein [Candidatus Deferrimicrobiaceae bacterium]
MKIRAAVVTVSDRSFRKVRADLSGPAVAETLSRLPGLEIVQSVVLPDDKRFIRRAIRYFADALRLDLVVTTGGTGVDPRDVTPDATLDMIDREVPGMADAMRSASLKSIPTATFSRAVAGVRRTTMVVNLPGSPAGARENLLAILDTIPHAIDKIRGTPTDCATP